MIRREGTTAAGSPAWVLISQVDHAHLAGELAEGWRDELPAVDVLLPTIDRHDDGWRAWERSPTIDAETGHPRSFLEMPSSEAHAIWRASIDGVADLGPLAQYLVAEHFCRLRRAGEASHDANIHAFLYEYGEHCQRWLSAWQAEDPSRNTPAVAAQAVDWLQFFDLFSLWFCMAERHQPHQLALPDGGMLSLTPHESTVHITPWPWRRSSRELVVRGRKIPAAALADDRALRRMLRAVSAVQLQWNLTPATVGL